MDDPEKVLSICGYCQQKVTSVEHVSEMVINDHKAHLTYESLVLRPCMCTVYGHISDYYAPDDGGEIIVEITDPLSESVVLRYLADPTLMGMDEIDDES